MSLKKIINTYGDDAENLVTTFSIASPLIISILSIFIISLLTITGFRIYILSHERGDYIECPWSGTGGANERLKLLLRSCLASNTTYTKRKKAAMHS